MSETAEAERTGGTADEYKQLTAAAELVECCHLMADIIDRLFLVLVQHAGADALDGKLLSELGRAADIMKDYE